jgi:hypothetical protein
MYGRIEDFAYLRYWRHCEPKGHARCWIVEIHLVFFMIVLLLKHRPAVLCDECIHLESYERVYERRRKVLWMKRWMVQYYKVDVDDASDGALARQLDLRGVRVSNREPDAGPHSG